MKNMITRLKLNTKKGMLSVACVILAVTMLISSVWIGISAADDDAVPVSGAITFETAHNNKTGTNKIEYEEVELQRAPSGMAYKVEVNAVSPTSSMPEFQLYNAEMPSETKYVAIWFGQDPTEDGCYVDFQPSIAFYSLQGSSKKVYTSADTSESLPWYFVNTTYDPNEKAAVKTDTVIVKETTQNYAGFIKQNRHEDFVEGWIIMPIASMKDSYIMFDDVTKRLDFRFMSKNGKTYFNAETGETNVTAEGVTESNKNYTKKQTIYYSSPTYITDVNAFLKNLEGIKPVDSPLWERPYDGQDYTGKFEGRIRSAFTYNILNLETTVALPVDTFDYAADNRLYREDCPDVGYHFMSDDLQFKLANTDYGMSYTYTAKAEGVYDIANSFRIAAGTGKTNIRILKNNEVIYPYQDNTSSDDTVDADDPAEDTETTPETDEAPTVQGYATLEGTVGAELLVDNFELNLQKDDKITVEAYATETNGGLMLSLGTPTYSHLTKSGRDGADTTAIYDPSQLAAFEEGNTEVVNYYNMTRRYAYEFVSKTDGTVLTADKIDNINKRIYNSTIASGFTVTSDDVTVDLATADYYASLKFVSPLSYNAGISFSAYTEDATAAEYRLVINGETVLPESGEWAACGVDNTLITTELDLNEDDIVELQVRSETACNVKLGVPTISFRYRAVSYTAEDKSYSALGSNPFVGAEDYNGEYVYSDIEAWQFDILNATEDEYISAHADMYDAETDTTSGRLYNLASGNGYVMDDTLLAELKDSESGKYGVSLGFTFPRKDDFAFHTGLAIGTPDTTAKIHARITLDGVTVWPQDSETGWYEADLEYGKSGISVPFYTLSAESGQTLRFEAYADEILTGGATAEEVVVNLGLPEIYKEDETAIDNDDVKAVIYPIANSHQYVNTQYNGASIPMESRWNFEVADFAEDGSFTASYPTHYDYKSRIYSFEGAENTPEFDIKNSKAKIYAAADSKQGISYRLISTGDVTAFYEGAPEIVIDEENPLSDNLKVYFRIIKTSIGDDGNTLTEALWPTADWEILDKNNPKSAIKRTSFEILNGDNVIIQFYAVDESASEPIAVNLKISSTVALADYIAEESTNYSFGSGYTRYMQISPFWNYEYAWDNTNIEYNEIEFYKAANGYWQGGGVSDIAFSPNQIFYIRNHEGVFEGKMPVVSLKFTAPKAGYYSDNNSAIRVYGQSTVEEAYARIIHNGETVWPENGGWETVTKENIKEIFESVYMEAGDVLRFEVTPKEELDADGRFFVRWTVGLTYSNYADVYLKSNNIYNMLTNEMYEHFLGLKSQEFDPDYEANEALSEKLKEIRDQEEEDEETPLPPDDEGEVEDDNNSSGDGEESIEDDYYEEAPDDSLDEESGAENSDDEINSDDNTSEENTSEDDSDEASEDEEVVTVRKKLVRKKINNSFPVWAIALIVGGSVAILAGAITVLFIILKKKGKLKLHKKI